MQIGRTLSYAGMAAALTSAGVLSLGGGAGAQAQGSTAQHISGVVTSVSGDGFEVLLPNTSREEVLTNGSTDYTETGSPDPIRGVAVGENVGVALAPSTSPSAAPTATRVEILLDEVRGKVVNVSDSSITLAPRKAGDEVVQITPSTDYFANAASVNGVAVGQRVEAYGTPSSGRGSDITAWYVDVRGASSSARSKVTVPPQQPPPTGPTSPTTVSPSLPVIAPTITTPPAGPNPQGFNPGGPMQGGAHFRGGHRR